MPKYQCPECEAILKRDAPIEEGKKIKCPKCESIFKAQAMRAAEEEVATDKPKKKAKAVAASNLGGDDDEVGGSYSVVKEKDDNENALSRDVNYGSLRDKFAKSKRGPAIAQTVQPSNLVLMQGFINAIAGLGCLMVALWPFIFSEEAPRGGAAREKIWFMVLGVFVFITGCVIAYGASRLHDLESYNWAMAGCIVATISIFPTGAAGGIWGIILLKDEEVKAAFEETLTKRDY